MRPHFRFFTVVFLASLTAGAEQKPADDLVNEQRTAAHEALAAKDYQSYRKHLLVLGSPLNHQAEITYVLAAADALLGHPTLAIDELNQFAATGLVRDPAHDPRFFFSAEPAHVLRCRAPSPGERPAHLSQQDRVHAF